MRCLQMMADSLESALDSEEMEDETEAEVDKVGARWGCMGSATFPRDHEKQ